jgi:methylmalonyl-CoA mutase N-terminal domain/subunit
MVDSPGKHKTISGMDLKAVYTPEDLGDFDYGAKLGQPGQYPFTRGIMPAMYRDSLWVMGQYSGFASAEEANQRYRYLIEQGQTGFSVALDLPTQMGYDSDHSMAEGEVGKVGVAVDSLRDVEELFQGIQLEKVRQIRTTANANALILLAMFVVFARKNNIDPNNIRFFLQNDVLKEYICRGTYIFPPGPSVKLAVDVIEYCSRHLTNWTPVAVCGYHIRDAGATAVQELAFTFANLICYTDAAVARKTPIDSFAPNLFFFLASHIDLLEEVAKFRAARRIWAKIMRERYGAKDPRSQSLKIFIMTMGGALTAEQPLNNVARVTLEALAAVLGGVQTIATSSYDEALSIPTEQSVTVALRTQQILAYESGVTQTVDPLGGSYVVEHLTDKIEQEVFAYLDKIEALGGSVACIEKGFFQKELADSAYTFQKNIDRGERVVVGVNRFRDDKPLDIPLFTVNDEVAAKQVRRLEEVRKSRDNAAVALALTALAQAARNGENLGEAMIEAVGHYATIGEISQVLRDVYGIYKPPTVF